MRINPKIHSLSLSLSKANVKSQKRGERGDRRAKWPMKRAFDKFPMKIESMGRGGGRGSD